MEPLLIISGPTGTGKSVLGLRLAQVLHGEIVNVDSVQIYKGAEIGSAMLSEEDRCGIPHHLMGFLSPNEIYNVSRFLKDSSVEVTKIREKGCLPILVGGSTLYITALLHGLAEIPEGDPALRKDLESLSDEALFAKLHSVDKVSSDKLHKSDRLRIIRAIEVFELTGTPISEAIAEHKIKKPDYIGLILVVCWRRNILYSKIERRSKAMLDSGLIVEARDLQKKYGENSPIFRSVGYAEVLSCFTKKISEDDLASKISMSTRRLAKRQMTFWRNEPLKKGWLIRPNSIEPNVTNLSSENRSTRRLSHEKSFLAYSVSKEELLKMIVNRLSQEFEKTEVWYINGEQLGLDG